MGRLAELVDGLVDAPPKNFDGCASIIRVHGVLHVSCKQDYGRLLCGQRVHVDWDTVQPVYYGGYEYGYPHCSDCLRHVAARKLWLRSLARQGKEPDWESAAKELGYDMEDEDYPWQDQLDAIKSLYGWDDALLAAHRELAHV